MFRRRRADGESYGRGWVEDTRRIAGAQNDKSVAAGSTESLAVLR